MTWRMYSYSLNTPLEQRVEHAVANFKLREGHPPTHGLTNVLDIDTVMSKVKIKTDENIPQGHLALGDTPEIEYIEKGLLNVK